MCYHLSMNQKKFDSPTMPGGRPKQPGIIGAEEQTKPGLPVPLSEALASQAATTLKSFPAIPGRDETVLSFISPEERERVSQQFSVIFSKNKGEEVLKDELKRSFVYARFGRYLTTEALKDWSINGEDEEITKRVKTVISLLLQEEEEEERKETFQLDENRSKLKADQAIIKRRLSGLIEDLIVRSERSPEYFSSPGFDDDLCDLLEMDEVREHPRVLLAVLGELSLKLPTAWGLHLIRLEHVAETRLYRELSAFLELNKGQLTTKPPYLREELRELRSQDLFVRHPRALERALARLRWASTPEEKRQALTARPPAKDPEGLLSQSRVAQVDAIEAMLKDE